MDTTNHPRTPVEVFDHLLELLLAKDMDAVVDLWAEDGVSEFPFAPPGRPRVLHGREEVRRYLAGYPDRIDIRAIPERTVHRTGEPDTVIAEFTATGCTVRTGADYELRYVVVLTVRDGLITGYRDYWSPVAAAAAAGELPELLRDLGEQVRA